MITILYAGNYKVFDGLVISVLSLVKHTKEPVNIKCLTMDLTELNPKFKPITEDCASYVRKILKDKNPESDFELIDLKDEFNKDLINSVNIKNHFTPYAMLRLLADKVDLPDKYIYLDTDTIVNRDLSILYNQDIEDYELGVVRDAYRLNRRYFNSGVMLVNHKKCLETGLYEKARYIVINEKLLYTDQTALNKSCKKRKMLPLIFNAKDKYYKDIVVHHFCNVRKRSNWFHRIKPWEVELVKQKMSAYDDILDDFVQRKNSPEWPLKAAVEVSK